MNYKELKFKIPITGGTIPPGACYHFKVDDDTKKEIMKKLK